MIVGPKTMGQEEFICLMNHELMRDNYQKMKKKMKRKPAETRLKGRPRARWENKVREEFKILGIQRWNKILNYD